LLEDRVQPNNLLALLGLVFEDAGSGLQGIGDALGTDLPPATRPVQVRETVDPQAPHAPPVASSAVTPRPTNPDAVDRLFRVDGNTGASSVTGRAATQQSEGRLTSADLAGAGQGPAGELAPPPSGSDGSLTNGVAPVALPPAGGSHPLGPGPGWVTHTPAPVPDGLSQTTTVASDDGSTLYVIGGGTGARPDARVNDVWSYDTKSDKWTQLASIPVADGMAAYGAAVQLNGAIYVFGGVHGAGTDAGPLNTLWIYDIASDSWCSGTPIPNSPAGRYGPAVALLNDGSGRVLVAGGTDGSTLFGDAYLYDTSMDSYTPVARIASIGNSLTFRLHAASNDDGSQVHVFGGGFAGSGHWVYDVASDTWSTAQTQMPNGVTDPGVVELPGTGLFYVVGAPGGVTLTTVHSTQVYDSSSNTWSYGPDLPAIANNTSAAIALDANGANLDVYLEGGFNNTTGSVPVDYSLVVA
jgi:N-acetylneuraminic acid mutarotase